MPKNHSVWGEVRTIAQRDGLQIAEIRKKSHSAKAVGQREVFNELLKDIRSGKFNGILTWAPDRLSRNAGDLGSLVDLMDQKALAEIHTFSQKFTNNPSEKFMLIIPCSTAKLENDNKSENVKRGLLTRYEQGLRPSSGRCSKKWRTNNDQDDASTNGSKTISNSIR